jgi:membrane-associated phospholipid phosphatase
MAKPRRRGPLDPGLADAQAPAAERTRHWPRGAPSAALLLAAGLTVLLVLVAVGTFLVKVAPGGVVGRDDMGVSRWFAAHRTPAGVEATRWVTDLAQTPTIAALAVLTVLVTALAWRRWREPLLVAAAVTGEVLTFLAITVLVHRGRPPVSHLDPSPPTSDFPSGHTAAAVAMYGSLALLAFQRARSTLVRAASVVLAVAIPVAVAVARVYRGMHFASDAIAGALLGGVWLWLAVRAVRLGVLHHALRATPRARPEARTRRRWVAGHG